MSDSPTGAGWDSTGRIVVGVDGSPSSEEALCWAVRQARATGSLVDAVIAWDFPIAYGVAPGNYEEDFPGDAARALDKSVQNVVGAEDAGLVRQKVLRGHPARVLVDASADAEMLVVGCRGHGGFPGMLLGSVSQHVVAQATCVVVVIHSHDEHRAAQS